MAAQVVLRRRDYSERAGRLQLFALRGAALRGPHGADRRARREQLDRCHLPSFRGRAVRRERRAGLRELLAAREQHGARQEADGCAAFAPRRRPLEGAVALHAVRAAARDGGGASADADAYAVLLAAHATAHALVDGAPAALKELEELENKTVARDFLLYSTLLMKHTIIIKNLQICC